MWITRLNYEQQLHSEFVRGYNVANLDKRVYYEAHIKPELEALKADHWDKDRFDRLMSDIKSSFNTIQSV